MLKNFNTFEHEFAVRITSVGFTLVKSSFTLIFWATCDEIQLNLLCCICCTFAHLHFSAEKHIGNSYPWVPDARVGRICFHFSSHVNLKLKWYMIRELRGLI